MRSSTSSSERRRRTRRQVTCLAVGAGVLVSLALLSYVAAPSAARDMDIVTSRLPPEDDAYYLAHDRGGHVDHHVLFHGIDRVALEHLRAAQVLFLGNSRLMFGLNRVDLQRVFADLGLTYYVLGFGHEEQDDFPARIIERYDLRPSWVVVNVDGFFWDGHSDWAAKTIEESDFDAWKLKLEAETAHRVRRRVHALVPQYVDLQSGRREFVIYRSRRDGTWFVATRFDEGVNFVWPTGDRQTPSARSLQSAETFKRDLEARGARLVLFLVPAPGASVHRAQALADHLGVPLIVPAIDDMSSIDGSHLSPRSSRRFSEVFLSSLREVLDQR
jgi:hypothetical protein